MIFIFCPLKSNQKHGRVTEPRAVCCIYASVSFIPRSWKYGSTPAVEYKLFMSTGLIGLKKTILFSSKQKPFGDIVVSQAVI